MFFLGYANGTLPETNIAPEIQPWKRKFLLETTIFIGAMLVLGSVNKVKLRATASTWHPEPSCPIAEASLEPSGADAILAPRHAWLPNIGSQKLQKGDISN